VSDQSVNNTHKAQNPTAVVSEMSCHRPGLMVNAVDRMHAGHISSREILGLWKDWSTWG